jgi:bifunctional non-homologous end joining protein LigD
MLATLVPEPFHYPGWVYEEKYDGYRILAYKEGDRVTLLSRNDKDRTESFREVADAVAALPARALLLDGEAVAFDKNLVSRFQLLQQGKPTLYAVFDCLYLNGRDLRNEPLRVRRVAAEEAIGEVERLFPARRLPKDGLKAYAVAKKKGWEGVVGKDDSSIYEAGRRSSKWLKVKVKQEEEFVIGGYTPPGGSRSHFGALLLGAFHAGKLYYVGKVGTGFDQKSLASLYQKFQRLVRKTPGFVNPPREKGAVWLAPKLVAQIAFQEWTDEGKLRQPVFLGLRDDKKASEVVLPWEPK